MKKVFVPLSSLILLFVSLAAIAQPSIGNNASFPIGTSVGIVSVLNTNLQQGASGSNVVWDFSGVQIERSQNAVFLSPSETPYAAAFGNTTAAVHYPEGLEQGSASIAYEFFSNNVTGLLRSGLANTQEITVNYIDPQQAIAYPFTYESANSDDFSAIFAVNGVIVTESGTIETHCDGYGTLILPHATIENVLRLRILQDYTDQVDGIDALTYHVETYAWFHPDLAYPLFIISTEQVENSPITGLTTAYYAQFDVLSANTPDVQAHYQLQTSPNPTQSLSQIRFDLPQSALVNLAVFNSLGQRVVLLCNEHLSVGSHIRSFDAQNLPAGIYFVELNIAGQRDVQKIIVQ